MYWGSFETRPDLGGAIKGIAELEPADLFDQEIQEVVLDALVQQQSRPCDATLPIQQEYSRSYTAYRRL